MAASFGCRAPPILRVAICIPFPAVPCSNPLLPTKGRFRFMRGWFLCISTIVRVVVVFQSMSLALYTGIKCILWFRVQHTTAFVVRSVAAATGLRTKAAIPPLRTAPFYVAGSHTAWEPFPIVIACIPGRPGPTIRCSWANNTVTFLRQRASAVAIPRRLKNSCPVLSIIRCCHS